MTKKNDDEKYEASEPVVEKKEVKKGEKTEADSVLEKMQEILKRYNGESNIPVAGTSPDIIYWELRNKYQRLTMK